ncbi:transposase [Streptomyces sp. NPDC004376]
METGKTVAEGAEDLGIKETALASWVSRARRAGAPPVGPIDELERLRRENAQLKQRQHGADHGALCPQTLHGPVGEVVAADPASVVGAISDFRAEHGTSHRVSCRAQGVSEAFSSRWAGSDLVSTTPPARRSTALLKVEYVQRRTFVILAAARIRIGSWITDFYNTRRLHSVCRWKSPID